MKYSVAAELKSGAALVFARHNDIFPNWTTPTVSRPLCRQRFCFIFQPFSTRLPMCLLTNRLFTFSGTACTSSAGAGPIIGGSGTSSESLKNHRLLLPLPAPRWSSSTAFQPHPPDSPDTFTTSLALPWAQTRRKWYVLVQVQHCRDDGVRYALADLANTSAKR